VQQGLIARAMLAEIAEERRTSPGASPSGPVRRVDAAREVEEALDGAPAGAPPNVVLGGDAEPARGPERPA
jgi:hypothetical protein